MENKYLKLFKEGVKQSIPAKYFFINFEGEILQPFNYFENYFNQSTDILENYSLITIQSELEYYLDSLPYEEIAYLFYYYFTKVNPLLDSKNQIKESVITNEIEDYYALLNKRASSNHYSFKNFSSKYQRWESVYHKEIINDKEILATQLKRNNRLISESKLNFSKGNPLLKSRDDFLYTSECQLVDIESKNFINQDDASTLFDRVSASDSVPFIWWRDLKGKDYYKIFSPTSEKDFPKFEYLDMPQKPLKGVIYFFVLKRNVSISNKVLKIAKDNYILSYIDCTRSTLVSEHPTTIEDEDGLSFILRHLSAVFNLKKNPESIVNHLKISTKVYFPPQGIDNNVIFYIIYTNPLFSHFFYSEGRNSYAENSQMLISYKGFKTPLYFDNLSNYTNAGSTVKFEFVGNVFKNGETLMEVKIKKATGEMELSSFLDELSCLIKYYNTNFLNIREFFSKFIKESENEIYEENEEEVVSTSVLYSKKLSQILSTTGDLYRGASKKVQCLKQPISIKLNQIEDWENLTLQNGEKRKVLTFPPLEGKESLSPEERDAPENRSYYFVCPDDEYPYPRLFKNSGNSTFPYLPICQTNQMDDEEKNILKNYYSLSNKNEKKEGQNENLIKTDKIRRFSEVAELPLEVTNFLKSIFDNYYQNYIRLGNDVGVNSFIGACLLTCENYRKIEDKNIRAKICSYFRGELLKHYISMKQEFYNENEESVANIIEDENNVIDSFLFYRGMEEIMDCNIFVFFSLLDRSEREVNFEIPRNNNFHIRPPNPERRTLLIFKHFGNELDGLSSPHYEYILTLPSDLDDTDESVDFSFYDRIYSAFQKVNESLIFNKNEDEEIDTRISPYSKVVWRDILYGKDIVSQYIDGYGKCRIINIKVPLSGGSSPSLKRKKDEKGKEENILVSLFVPPSPPLNVKVENKIYTLSPLRDQEKNDIEKILNHFGDEPTKIDESGIYFRILDYGKGIYIPFVQQHTENDFFNYKKVKRRSALLIECIVWCWRCDALSSKASDWCKEYLLLDDIEPMPNYSEVKITFPVLKNVNTRSALLSIEKWWNGVFSGSKGKIYLNSEIFLPIVKYLSELDTLTEGLIIPPERYISSEIKNSFSIRGDTVMLFSENSYTNFVKSITQKGNDYLNEVIDFSKTLPQLIKIQSGIYIVHSVENGELLYALRMCEIWKNTHNVSLSLTSKKESERVEDYSYGIYIQTSDKRITTYKDFTNGGNEYYQILMNQGKYYPMLKML